VALQHGNEAVTVTRNRGRCHTYEKLKDMQSDADRLIAQILHREDDFLIEIDA
jgi:hypothetical protein